MGLLSLAALGTPEVCYGGRALSFPTRKTLASQLDRLDSMLDGLSEGLNQAVASAVRDAVRCPLCDYDLRGLAEPRCPECGYRFVWEDLTDPTRRRHPYLFEHHPRRNFWSFRRTFIAGLRPRRFWSTLYPAQLSRPSRLDLLAGWCRLLRPGGVLVVYQFTRSALPDLRRVFGQVRQEFEPLNVLPAWVFRCAAPA